LGKSEGKQHYFSFMLRVWRANGEGEAAWRASLESPHTGERIGFASLGELFGYLKVKIKEVDHASEEGPGEAQLTLNVRIDAVIK